MSGTGANDPIPPVFGLVAVVRALVVARGASDRV